MSLAPGLIGIPAVDWMWTRSAEALVHLWRPEGTLVRFTTESTALAGKRNRLVRELLDSNREWLLFMDSDMAPSRRALMQLLAHDLPAVGALYFTRHPPYGPCASELLPPRPGEPMCAIPTLRVDPTSPLKRVELIGTGFLLLHRSIFEALEKPWFSHEDAGEGSAEDVYFCRRLRDAGLPLYLDTSLVVRHVGVIGIGVEEARGANGSLAPTSPLDHRPGAANPGIT